MAQNNLLHQCQLLRKNQWRKGAAIGLFLMEQAWRIAEDGCGVGLQARFATSLPSTT